MSSLHHDIVGPHAPALAHRRKRYGYKQATPGTARKRIQLCTMLHWLKKKFWNSLAAQRCDSEKANHSASNTLICVIIIGPRYHRRPGSPSRLSPTPHELLVSQAHQTYYEILQHPHRYWGAPHPFLTHH